MQRLLEISIQDFSLGSFLAMLGAFWALGFFLLRGAAGRRKMQGPSRQMTAPEGHRKAEASHFLQ